ADSDLVDTAFTLPVGREALEQRLAFAVTTIAQLEQKLRAFVDGNTETAGELYLGDVKKSRDALGSLDEDDAASLIRTWLDKRKYNQLLRMWAKGLSVDWAQLYEADAGSAVTMTRRVSLPNY